MDIEDYAVEARKTATYQGGLAYAALGLVGEATEYLQDPSADELGDVLWYVIAVADEIGYAPAEIWEDARVGPASRLDLRMVCSAGRVAEHVKKHLGKGEELHAHRKLLIARELSATLGFLVDLAASRGHRFDEIAAGNVAKLRARQASGTLLAR